MVAGKVDEKIDKTAGFTGILDLLRGSFVDCGELHVSKTSLGTKRLGNRYLIYLPLNRNYLWHVLHSSKARVKVLVELPKNPETEVVK
jgi:hypothetical protein